MIKASIILAALAATLSSAPIYAEEAAGITGEVINLDEVEAGKITIKHAAIPGLGIGEDNKVSDFRPKDKSLFGAVKAGDKVRFSADRINGELTITRIDRQ